MTDDPKTTDHWGRLILTDDEKQILEDAEEAFWGAYEAAPSGEGVCGGAYFGCRAAVLVTTRNLSVPEAVARAIGDVGTYGVARKYKLVPREPGDPL